ncbi:MAG: ABC transporter permease [Hyphomicrobiales bacterium]
MNELGRGFALALGLISHGDSELTGIVLLSLAVSLTATFAALLVGAPMGAGLAIAKFRARGGLILAANALLGLPPVVVGLAVYLLLSRSGPLGRFGMLFTPPAMILAQITLLTPIVIALTHRFADVLWDQYGGALMVDGASKPRSVLTILAIGKASLLTVFLAAFGRAISEVGAIIVVGGNIRGYTRTMTTAIALETSKGDLALALGLGLVLIALSVTVNAIAFLLARSWKK